MNGSRSSHERTADRSSESGPSMREQAPQRAGELLLLGVWMGLLGGLLEVALRGAQKIVFGERLWLSPDLVWMTPTASVLLLGSVTAALVVLRAAWPSLRLGCRRLAGILAFLVFAGPLLATTRIHWAAALLLALGLATVVARLASRHPVRLIRLARSTVVVLALLVAGAGVLVHVGDESPEGRRGAGPPSGTTGRTNVLLLILDTVRASSTSLAGYGRPTTPHLERLAAAGASFDHAWATAPWTLPSHATLFTGRYPHELSADWETPLDDEHRTLAEHFATRGYRTGGFVGNLIYATYETGLDRGFARYDDYPVSASMVANSHLLTRLIVLRIRRWLGVDQFLVWKSAEEINRGFLDWLDEEGNERPFFAFLNYMDAHAPYLPPDSLEDRFGPPRMGRALADLSERRDWSAEELRAERAAYDGTIAYADQALGALLSDLESRGLLSTTLVVVTSDHGEQFGEHGLVDHGNSLYRELLQVPLVISLPGRVPEAVRVRRPVSLRDLPATIVDLALEGKKADFPGSSLATGWATGRRATGSPLLAEVSAGVRMPDWFPVMRGDMKSIVHDGFHYILNGDGVEELFYLPEDPAEEENLAASSRRREVVAALRERLRATLEGRGSARSATDSTSASGPERP